MKFILISIMVLAGLFFTETAYSQEIAIKSNLLYDATGTINLGVEFGVGKKTTIDILGSYNPWVPTANSKARLNHILIQPEFRYWLNERFNGHFFGVHAHYAYYRVGGSNWLLDSAAALSNASQLNLKNSSYGGWLVGAGASYGYHWIIGKRWSLEATVGIGYAYIDYSKYNGPICGTKIESGSKHYFGPTKAGITLIFMIK